jgi:DNA replication protein DnaC
MPSLERSIDQIDENLRNEMHAVVNGRKKWPLFIVGPSGVGKTCAALCMLDRTWGAYYTANELVDTVASAQRGQLRGKQYGSKITQEMLWTEWSDVQRVALFVLDELGTRERVGDLVYNTTKQLIDCRASKPLIVISNLDLPRIVELYDDRVASRLVAGTVVLVQGQDRRLAP